MSDPHKRNIEKLLQAAGARRLEQSGVPEMHPAIRETLQTEVRRVYGATPRVRKRTVRWFLRLLPKVAVFVALGACAWLLVFRQEHAEPKHLALNDPSSEPTPTDDLRLVSEQVRSSDSPASNVQLAEELKQEARPTTSPALQRASSIRPDMAQPDLTSGPPDPAAAPPRSVVGSDYFKADRQGMYLGIASADADAESAIATDISVAVAGLMKTTTAGVAFSPHAEDARSAVLQNFTVLNEGSLVRLIDADGSTYEGQLQPLENEPAGSSGLKTAAISEPGASPVALPPGEADTAGLRSLNFRLVASGTNRSLGQTVQFAGTLELTEPQWDLGKNLFRNTLPLVSRRPGETQPAEPSPSQGGRLQGTAVLGDGQNVAVEATTTSQ